jgi:outer membrane immunogenic protein
MRMTQVGLAAIVAAGCAASSALADGMPQNAPRYVRDCASFHGFYVGANAGGTLLRSTQNNLDGYGTTPGSFGAFDTGFSAGGQIGFNLQSHCTLFGVEGDWNWARLSAETNLIPNGNVTQFNVQTASSRSARCEPAAASSWTIALFI